MAIGNLQVGQPKVVSATGNVKNQSGALLGVFVSTSSSGTLTLYDSSGTSTSVPLVPITGTLSDATWYPIPIGFSEGLYAVVGGTLSCTFVFA